MTEAEFFVKQMENVFNTQKNKRRGRDSIIYESNIIARVIRSMDKRLLRELRILHNYTFLASVPQWREIMATEFEGRRIDHEICDEVIPLAEKILSPYTFNNRKGKGSHAAINQLIEHITEVSENYTKPARVIKLDFKGYFPNALWSYAEKCIDEIIDLSDKSESEKSYLKWLTMIAINCNPVAHCEYRTPKYMWDLHIKPEKSVFNKPEGVGASIGRLIWQTSMGLYINDIILWLTNDCGIKLVCFVDDIVMVIPEHLHEYALSLIPEIRRRLKDRNVRLNENKFYDQPVEHGLEFLGTHIEPHRMHLNNSTYYRATMRIHELNGQRYKELDKMVQSFNSYSGLLKNRTDYKRIIKLKNMLIEDWWFYLVFNEQRLCLGYKPEYSVNKRLNDKYNLNLKKYDTTRATRKAKRSLHRKSKSSLKPAV